MPKIILITGATDGIGLEAAKKLAAQGHTVLLHGRNQKKLESAIAAMPASTIVESYLADFSSMTEVVSLAQALSKKHHSLDVLINNAGILKTPATKTQEGLDIRFAVNTLAPYLLTQQLMPLLNTQSRVINLSSAAQRSVDTNALANHTNLSDMEAYAQSKLAITMWSRKLGSALKNQGPMVCSVNPGSLLATKMVKEGFGMEGNDINIGANILVRAALSDEFTNAHGDYFDNDAGEFSDPHIDALDNKKVDKVVAEIETVLKKLLSA